MMMFATAGSLCKTYADPKSAEQTLQKCVIYQQVSSKQEAYDVTITSEF